MKCYIECNINLEYTMLVASNLHISALSQPLWKNGNDWKRYVPAVPMISTNEIWTHTTVGVFHQKKCWLLAWICLIWKVMEYTNDHSPDACIIPHFRKFFYNWSYSKLSMEKSHLSWLVPNFYEKNTHIFFISY